MSTDYAPALSLPSPHRDGWGIFTPRYIIVHATAGDRTVQSVATTFDQRGTSTHYAVGTDGTVAQYVDETSAAWGNGVLSAGHDPWWDNAPDGNPNTNTFSIEHCKASLDNSDAITPAQQAASFALIEHLCAKWNIPRRRADAQGGITGHYSIDPVNRAFCPGTYPWDALFAYLNGGSSVGFQKQSDGTGKDAKGHTCGTGLMWYIAQHGITADGLSGEQFYDGGSDTFLPLADGTILTAHNDGKGNWTFAANEGAQLVLNFFTASQHPAPTPAPQPSEPSAYQQAIAAFRTALALLPATS